MNPNTLFDSVMHVAMLWTLLLAFFIFYGSGVEKAAFKQQFANIIQTNLGTTSVKQLLLQAKPLSPQLVELEPQLQRPDPEVTANNAGVIRTGVVIALGLIAVLFALAVSNPGIPVMEVIKQNALVFGFVAIVEFAFFRVIVTKYVPALPSTMLKSALAALQIQ